MPEITRFNGIVIKMFVRGEHNPPHFHAIYNEHNSIISIEHMIALEGDLPSKQLKEVIIWANSYKDELMKMWETKTIEKLPPLK